MQSVSSKLRSELWNQTTCEQNLNTTSFFSWSHYNIFTSGGAAWIEVSHVMEMHLISSIHKVKALQ